MIQGLKDFLLQKIRQQIHAFEKPFRNYKEDAIFNPEPYIKIKYIISIYGKDKPD
jgi:hypothetical protein